MLKRILSALFPPASPEPEVDTEGYKLGLDAAMGVLYQEIRFLLELEKQQMRDTTQYEATLIRRHEVELLVRQMRKFFPAALRRDEARAKARDKQQPVSGYPVMSPLVDLSVVSGAARAEQAQGDDSCAY